MRGGGIHSTKYRHTSKSGAFATREDGAPLDGVKCSIALASTAHLTALDTSP
jgi:hypothetical protein